MKTKKRNKVEAEVARMVRRWKRGMLSFWVFGLLMIRPMYGLEVKQEIEHSTQGRMKLGTSTIYQLLQRLEEHKLVESQWQRTTHGPPRRYYHPTAIGREVMQRYITEVFSPGSPIPKALTDLAQQLAEQFAEGK